MKTISQISAQFASVKAILDSALQHGGGRYEAPTYGAAVHFRQRAYAFRKAYREACYPEASPYEILTLRRIEKGETTVIIEPQTLSGTFIPAEGDPIIPPSEDDPLLEEALALRKELDL